VRFNNGNTRNDYFNQFSVTLCQLISSKSRDGDRINVHPRCTGGRNCGAAWTVNRTYDTQRGETKMIDHKVPRNEEIQQRAYELYVARGGEDGRDVEDWLAAEKELTESSEESTFSSNRRSRAATAS
jgi:hypothetical protein